jgi:hypothetical protein
MNRHDFRNGLCIIRSIDMHQLEKAGVIRDGDGKAWQAFRSNPERFFLCCEEAAAEALWGLIERRLEPVP